MSVFTNSPDPTDPKEKTKYLKNFEGYKRKSVCADSTDPTDPSYKTQDMIKSESYSHFGFH